MINIIILKYFKNITNIFFKIYFQKLNLNINHEFLSEQLFYIFFFTLFPFLTIYNLYKIHLYLSKISNLLIFFYKFLFYYHIFLKIRKINIFFINYLYLIKK